MGSHFNALGQLIGAPLPDWMPVQVPPRTTMEGRFCRIEPIDPERHAADLYAAFSTDREHRNWTYLPYGPLQGEAEVRAWMTKTCMGADPQFHAILDAGTGKAVGVASYLRIDAAHGVIEVGHINYSPLLQRKAAATEAMFLMMRRVFDELGYRRYEWKCDALNAPSRKAALRFGFRYDGLFPQATIYKGRNRDTAWYSILDGEWPEVSSLINAWLDPSNFTGDGTPKTSLAQAMNERSPRPVDAAAMPE
jgi:RimJ/RimL family protein N-acetyltransferase